MDKYWKKSPLPAFPSIPHLCSAATYQVQGQLYFWPSALSALAICLRHLPGEPMISAAPPPPPPPLSLPPRYSSCVRACIYRFFLAKASSSTYVPVSFVYMLPCGAGDLLSLFLAMESALVGGRRGFPFLYGIRNDVIASCYDCCSCMASALSVGGTSSKWKFLFLPPPTLKMASEQQQQQQPGVSEGTKKSLPSSSASEKSADRK